MRHISVPIYPSNHPTEFYVVIKKNKTITLRGKITGTEDNDTKQNNPDSERCIFSHMQNQSIYDMKMKRETEREESYPMKIGRIKRE